MSSDPAGQKVSGRISDKASWAMKKGDDFTLTEMESHCKI